MYKRYAGQRKKTKLERISQLSQEKPHMAFMSIRHLINRKLLKDYRKK
ncbi:MAG: hypothetical protein K1W37_17160 [Lachnospiraceae bacterium]